jgi:hypothetical protein
MNAKRSQASPHKWTNNLVYNYLICVFIISLQFTIDSTYLTGEIFRARESAPLMYLMLSEQKEYDMFPP